jgi:UDP-N-acetylmuramate dehydrogenase
MKTIELKKLLQDFEGSIIYDSDLKKKTWFNIGGKAKVFFKANELKELVKFLKTLNNKEKIHVIGAGSNTLISDKFFDGVIIKLGKNFKRLTLKDEDQIICGAAVMDKKLAQFAADNSLAGFEFMNCIPGSVGGGIKINSGCFGMEIKDILISIQAIDHSGNIINIPRHNIRYVYRDSDLPNNLIFLSVSFQGRKDKLESIIKKMQKLKKIKEKNQPNKIKTGGSTFKNPITQTNKKVWELIKESVDINTKFGDAQISKKHANFFVNNGNAKFNDMKKLIEHVKSSVKLKTGVHLETEIIILE